MNGIEFYFMKIKMLLFNVNSTAFLFRGIVFINSVNFTYYVKSVILNKEACIIERAGCKIIKFWCEC